MANLLATAWRETGSTMSFEDWSSSGRRIVIHGDGQSRRLPGYAPTGKPLIPIPVFRWSRGQRLDQTLLDLVMPSYERVLKHAPPGYVAMVTAGDVILGFGDELPPFPEVDVLVMGMWSSPGVAKDHGVFFSPRSRPTELSFVLQKPSTERLEELAESHLQLLDTGLWLFSERAVIALMKRAGWTHDDFSGGRASSFELYGQLGLALGADPTSSDPAFEELTSAVVPLPNAAFHHLGTSRALIDSISAVQAAELDGTRLGATGTQPHPTLHTQNARVDVPLDSRRSHSIWIENSTIPSSWELVDSHVLTGVPDNAWGLRLWSGLCLDFVPVDDDLWCVRPYGIDDTFAGSLSDPLTEWLGAPFVDWLGVRGISLDDAGLDPAIDLQEARLFPVLTEAELDADFLSWLWDERPDGEREFAERWCTARRLSAHEIVASANLERQRGQRLDNVRASLASMLRNARRSVFYRLDLEATSQLYAESGLALPEFAPEQGASPDPMAPVRDEMFRSAVLRHRDGPDWRNHESDAFAHLRELIVRDAQLAPAEPERAVLDDQIVWGRSPVRFDLAGGWTDTPPYCLEYGGRVLNVAVDLNGQPPIQAFGRFSSRPEIVIRSIDLGVEARVSTWDDLNTFGQPGDDFGLAKAALALAGFLPRFYSGPSHASLRDQLEHLGGGIELSMLCAVPKGSGLGTSSILAATLLATLSDLCGLGWDHDVVFDRTLALEQLLTTGGGWQDQAGGMFRGLKLIETDPGLTQNPGLRWLPDELLGTSYANRSVLLYYTGLTRLAKDILHEIVRGFFLNSSSHLRTMHEIGANALAASDAAQRCNYPDLTQAIDRAWVLNQHLDSGTLTPGVQSIMDATRGEIAAAKLLGAGGGGYLLMFAHDEDAAHRARRALMAEPPNDRARFVDFSVSPTGLQVTRS